MLKGIWNKRNLLIIIGLSCEVVFGISFYIASRQYDEIYPVTQITKEILKLPKGKIRDHAIAIIQIQRAAYLKLDKQARTLGELIGALGLLFLVEAWRAHREMHARK
jgi:hypothetical protein